MIAQCRNVCCVCPQFAGLYVYTDANASAVYTACNKTEGRFPCMDGKSCYEIKTTCNTWPDCTADYRDEMGCEY